MAGNVFSVALDVLFRLYYILMHFGTCIQFKDTTRLKNKIENNSTWEGDFYQSEWVKINSNWVILVFSL